MGIRVAICALVYAALWGVYALVVAVVLPYDQPQVWHLVVIVPPMFIAGATAVHFSLDLEFTNGLFHYSLYLMITVLLRLVMGLNAF